MSTPTKKLQYSITFFSAYDETLKEQIIAGLKAVFSPHIKAGRIQVQNTDCLQIVVVEIPESRSLEENP